MCTGTQTNMSCGHTLRHLEKCKEGTKCRRKTFQTAYIADTCAQCDREAHFHKSRATYEAEHEALMDRYVKAKQLKRTEVMRRLERMMALLHRDMRDRNAKIGMIRGDPDVLWAEGQEDE